MDAKLDKILEKISNIDITLAKQQASLDEHIRRTEIAESHIDDIKEDLKPVHAHINMVQGGLKVIMAIGAAVLAILKILKRI